MIVSNNEPTTTLSSRDARICEVLRLVGLGLEINVDKTQLDLGDMVASRHDHSSFDLLINGARQFDIFIAEVEIDDADVSGALLEGLPVVLALEDDTFWVFEVTSRNRIEANYIGEENRSLMLRKKQLRELLAQRGEGKIFIAKKELECEKVSSLHAHGSTYDPHRDHAHVHMKPTRRFIALLKLDQRDVFTVALFAAVAGILNLATPLAIESLVNVVSWGTYLQPLLVLAVILFSSLGLAGILKVLQTVLVEVIQRRQFVHIVGDLAHRFPRANQEAMEDVYPREYANRVFDIMTIQKSSASVLLDGVSIVLTTFIGLLLLAFYHPILLGFDLILVTCMIAITLLLGRDGIRTSIEESRFKYQVAHWLQDVIATPAAFKVNGGELLAIEHANRLTTDYIAARQRHFRVVLRQTSFAIGLQVVASTALLSIGGWLVIRQQLTLGQLVASELVVTLVVGAFAKAGKSIETFYDLMAGMDKVGHLLDIPVDPRFETGELLEGPAEVRWSNITLHSGVEHCELPETRVASKARVALFGTGQASKSMLIKTLAGMMKPKNGIVEIAGFDAQHATVTYAGRLVGYAGLPAIFNGTVQENVDLGRSHVGRTRVREVLVEVGLWDGILRLPHGLQSRLHTDGTPLTSTQVALLAVARAMAGKPNLLLIDSLLDLLAPEDLATVWAELASPSAPWTLIVSTNQQHIVELCDVKIEFNGH
jgi:putative ABC transport system ATP-binding protein